VTREGDTWSRQDNSRNLFDHLTLLCTIDGDDNNKPILGQFNFLCNSEKTDEDRREGAHSHTYSKRLLPFFQIATVLLVPVTSTSLNHFPTILQQSISKGKRVSNRSENSKQNEY